MLKKTRRNPQRRVSITADLLLLRTPCSACLGPSEVVSVTASIGMLPLGHEQSPTHGPDK